jgi:hypothetical protein
MKNLRKIWNSKFVNIIESKTLQLFGRVKCLERARA